MNRVDFIVIGAGIAGSSAAAELAGEHSVVLLEAEDQPGYHATGRSAALFSETYGNRAVRALAQASRSQIFHPPQDFARDALTSRRGVLFIATLAQLEPLRAFARAGDIQSCAREVDATEALKLCPSLRAEYVAGGLYEPNATDIDVHGLQQAYLRQLRAHGGRLLTRCPVEAIERRHGEWHVRCGEQHFVAPVVINAAGAWADDIATRAAVAPLDLRPLRRTALLVDAPAGTASDVWPAVVDIDEQFYFKPDAGRLLLSPADETPMPPGDVQADEWDIAVAVDRVTSALDIDVRHVRRSWAGLRTFAPDRTPVVGFDAHAPGFFWLAGQGGYGVQTAPAMSRVAAALACGRTIPQEIADFGVAAADLSPARFARAPA